MLNWNQVEKRISELIKMDRYLNQKEKELYPQWLEQQEIRRAEVAEERRKREILSTAPADKELGETVPYSFESEYRLLSRLKSDCEYFLGEGARAEKHLWAGSVDKQIEKMRELYEQLPEKPEWLSNQDIDNYERQMQDVTPEQTKERYEYHLGSTVYIGANEYEIQSFDDERVMLYDLQFPLFNKEMTRAEFDQ